MAKRDDRPQVLCANDLLSGRVVWWDGAAWSADFSDARRAEGDEARAALLEVSAAEMEANHVVAAELVPLDEDGLPHGLRDARRQAGPSITLPTSAEERA